MKDIMLGVNGPAGVTGLSVAVRKLAGYLLTSAKRRVMFAQCSLTCRLCAA